ncbi:MAG: copper amine oxidase N-terminal domain-containing protein [Anaerovoracaceae bacterium]
MKNMRKIMVPVLAVLVTICAFTAVSFADSAQTGDASVMLDGAYLSFDQDSLPKNVNGRIMVPYRAIFESLGAEVDFDVNTKVISGSNDRLTLSMKNGDKNISVVYADGTSEVKTMDVAPYISNGRTFVPTRFVSEVMGYSVGWDSDNKTVVIIDTDAITADAREDFGLLTKVQELNGSMDQAYEIDGSLNMTADISDALTGTESPAGQPDMSVTGTIGGYVEGSNVDMNMKLSMDVDGENMTSDIQVKFDGESGDMYMKGDGITEEQQWMKFNVYDIFDQSGLDLRALLNGKTSYADMDKLLSEALAAASDSYTVDSYEELNAAYNVIKSMFGDDAFVKSGNKYTAEFDLEKIASAVSSGSGMDLSDVLEESGLGDAELTGKMVITTDSAGKAVGCDVEIRLASEEEGIEMVISAKSTKLSADVSLNMSVEDVLSMTFDMMMKLKETTATVDPSIPAGDTILDLGELFGSLLGAGAAA